MTISRRHALAAGVALLTSFAAPPLRAQSTMAGAARKVRLSNGRWLSYSECGDPSGQLVFYFHGTPGSRLEGRLIEMEAFRAGVRLVAVDRPGLGLSTYYSGRRILDWPDDVQQLAAALGYAEAPFGILAISGGAPYGLACARLIPHRLTHVAIVSGHASINVPGTTPGSEDRMIALVTRRPRLATVGFNVVARRLDRRPDKVISQLSKNWTASDKQLLLGNPVHYQYLIANLNEASRCGTDGLVTDVRLLGSPWCFSLCDITGVPISIWHGGCDRIAPVSMAHYFHRQLADSELVIDPAAGHVTMLKWHIDEIFSRLSFPGLSASPEVVTSPELIEAAREG